jgi:outer membrane protein TolC
MVGGILLLPIISFGSVITFNQALSKAFHNNNELKAKKINVDIAQSKYHSAKSYDFGNLFVEYNALRTDDDAAKTVNAGSQAYYKHTSSQDSTPYTDIFNMRFVSEIPLFTGFKISSAKKMANLQINAKKFTYQHDKNKLAIEVLKAYNGVVAAKYYIKALKSAEKTVKSLKKMIEGLYKQGMVIESDVLTVKARESDIKVKMIEAINKYDMALSYLQFLTGDISITDVKDFEVVVPLDSNLKDLQVKALLNRKDYKAMQNNLLTMKYNVKMTESIKYPTLGAHLEYGWRTTDDPKFSKNNDYYIVGAQAKWYWMKAGENGKIEEAKKKRLQVGYYLLQMKRGIKLDVKKKFLKLKSTQAIIDAKKDKLQTVQSILSKYESMYKNGLINVTLLFMQQAELQKAQAELIKAKYDQAIAAAELKASIGDMIKK